MSWKTLAVAVNKEEVEALESLLWETGAVSVTLIDGEDHPIFEPGPGEIPLWARLTVTAMYEDDIDTESLAETLRGLGYQVLFTDELGDRVWEREWMSQFKPMKFGQHLWVCPTGFVVDEPDAVILNLDPGLAFGTGTHATTSLCLAWLDQHLHAREAVLDYGCGSGILGIAAKLLGARQVVAVDNDPQALVATKDNSGRNGIEGELVTCLPEDFNPGSEHPNQYSVVLANILAQPLISLSHLLSEYVAPGGDLVLSGIMSSQSDWVKKAYQLELVSEEELDGWICLHFKKAI
ncbi:MAG: ribosomal protein L11 methyltransferase [Candidatus Azotimanducaceae bacterium]|jgi:ribosomal protein L11 methyltransferase